MNRLIFTALAVLTLNFVNVEAGPVSSDFQASIANVNDSEVSDYLETAFEVLNFGPESHASLRNLQVALYRNNITRLYDIPQERQAVTELLRGIPLDPVSLALLEQGLGVKLPELQSSLLTGYGYNFQTDSVLPLSPFNLTGKKKLSPIGFIIPSVYDLTVVNEMKEIFILYKRSEEYYSSRFSFKESSSESLTLHTSCWWFFCWNTGSTRVTGYNSEKHSSLSGVNTTTEELSSSQEHRLFQLQLIAQPELSDLSTHFVAIVNSLDKFDPSDCDSQSSWKHFFDNYGTHVVSSTFGGGSLNIVLRGSHLYEILKESMETNGQEVTIMNYFHASSSNHLATSDNSTLYLSNVYKSVQFKAGDSRLQKPDLFNIDDQEEKNRIIEDWKNSIPQNPVLLDSNLQLASMLDYIELVDPALRTTLNYQAAVNYWLSGSLHTCEWYRSRPRPVTIWFDENKDGGFPHDHPVRTLNLQGAIVGAPIPIRALNVTDLFMCSEHEKCLVQHVQAHCEPEECPKKSFHLHYESEYTNLPAVGQ